MDGSSRRRAAVGLVGLASLLTGAGIAHASPPEIYPLAKVQRGQTGYGMTTMAGATPERFTFEVVSVVHNFLPKQDLVLVKSDDQARDHRLLAAGHVGQPALSRRQAAVRAFSHGFRFNKVALGRCTPLEYMKHEGLDTPRRGSIKRCWPQGADGRGAGGGDARRIGGARRRRSTPRRRLDALGPAHKSWLLSAPLPAAIARPDPVADAGGQVLQASVPLSVAGFSAPAFGALEQLFGNTDLAPMRAGGTSSAHSANSPHQFVMGGAIAVELIRGDMSAAAIGTVSYIDGNKVLAFGHPMFQSGETYAPVATADVATVIPSSQSAFVMATAANEIGSLVQDRQAAIMADTSLRSPTIPLDIEITSTAGTRVDKGAFHTELLDNKFMTPSLAGAAVQNAINYYLPDKDDSVTARVESTIRIKGQEPISFVDYMYANDGAGSVMGSVRGLRVLVPLMLNPFQPVRIERVDIKVDLRFEANFGEIKELRLPTAELIAGERNQVNVVMTTWDGKDIIEQVPVDVPLTAAGSIVQLDVSSGDVAKLDAAPPTDLPSLLAAFHKLLPGTVWAATIYPADEGVAVDGKLVRDLPASAADKLHPQSRTQLVQPYKPITRTLSPAKRVINGGASTLVRVRAR